MKDFFKEGGKMRKYNCFNFRFFKIHRVKTPFFLSVGKRKFFMFKIIIAVLLICSFMLFSDAKIRPIIKETAGNLIKNKLENILNTAVGDYFSEKGVTYDEIVTLQKTTDGNISAITANTVYMNTLKSGISKYIDETLSNENEVTVRVPFGTLIGSDILNGRGTDIKIKVHLYGFAVTDFESGFESAGLNQTRHSIYICVKISSFSYVGAVKINETVESKILVAETVIVGTTPEFYSTKN